MQAEFWHQRWQAGEIGFHKHEYNAHMTRFIDLLGIEQGDNILVPLCGKSLDMIWLRDQKFNVTGIEISPIATSVYRQLHVKMPNWASLRHKEVDNLVSTAKDMERTWPIN